MRKACRAIFLAAVFFCAAAVVHGTPAWGEGLPLSAKAACEAGFSPDGSAKLLVLAAIGEAKATLLVACYEFTDRDIAAALESAAHRGVKVRILADSGAAKAKYSQVRILEAAGIPVRVATRYAIMHDKFMVIDGALVETGSYNYSAAASKANAENVLILRGVPEVAKVYAVEWQRMWDEAGTAKK